MSVTTLLLQCRESEEDDSSENEKGKKDEHTPHNVKKGETGTHLIVIIDRGFIYLFKSVELELKGEHISLG